MNKQEVLHYYQRYQASSGRDRAILQLKRNIADKTGNKKQWRIEVLYELFGESYLPVMDKIDWNAPTQPPAPLPAAQTTRPWKNSATSSTSWDQQLADLLGPVTPVYIVE